MTDSPFPFIFGNTRPVCVEIGPGMGEFLIAAAAADPSRNYYAVERSAPRVRHIERRIAQLALTNVFVVRADARCLLALLPDACVHAYHVHFPDPWWKRRHHRRRVITPEFVTTLRRTLVPGGRIELVTDVPEYFTRATRQLEGEPGLEALAAGQISDNVTSFARKAARRGASILMASYGKRLA